MKKQQGFTLIELLVVIAIIGLLSTIAVIALNSARQKSRDSKRIADVKQIQTALEMYYNDKNAYPSSDANGLKLGGGETGSKSLSGGGFADTTSGTVYMATVPSNPEPSVEGTSCATANSYTYTSFISPYSTYRIVYCLANATGGVSSGWNTACESGVSGCTTP